MKGLFILYHYPPALKGESPASSIQNLRFIQGLKSNGVDCTVIRKGIKDSLHSTGVVSLNFISTRIPKAIVKRVLPDLMHLPDMERFLWARKAKRYLSRQDLNKYDWVHTTCSPYSNHLVGLHIKEKYNLPWIAQFYDPWVDNPYRKFKYDIFRKLDKKYEALVAEKSDLIILSNEIIKKKWIDRYGKEIEKKIFILPFCTDPNIRLNNNKTNNTKLILLHAGGIYGQRSIEELVDAIDKLKKEVDKLEDKIEIRLVGSVNKTEVSKIKAKKLFNIFQLYGKKNYSFVQNQLGKANILLVIDSLQQKENVHFPSKLVEYFSYQKLIIGMTPENSPTAELLKKAGHYVFHSGESFELKELLKKFIIRRNLINTRIEKSFYTHFLPNEISKKYIKMINNLMLLKK